MRRVINHHGQKIVKTLHKLIINLLGPKIILRMHLLGPKIRKTKQMQQTTNLLGWKIIRIVLKILIHLLGWKIKKAIIVVLQFLHGWKEATIVPNLIQICGKISKLLRSRNKKNSLKKKWREKKNKINRGKGLKNKKKKKRKNKLT